MRVMSNKVFLLKFFPLLLLCFVTQKYPLQKFNRTRRYKASKASILKRYVLVKRCRVVRDLVA